MRCLVHAHTNPVNLPMPMPFAVPPAAGNYYAMAGPIDDTSLSFALDSHGRLRFFRLETGSSCISLGDVANGLGLGLTVPSNSFSLCSVFLQLVPSFPGAL